MGWFTRVKEGITTSTEDKKETPEGLWYKCPECSEITTSARITRTTCGSATSASTTRRSGAPSTSASSSTTASTRRSGRKLIAGDPLKFEDTKKYTDRLSEDPQGHRAERCAARCRRQTGQAAGRDRLHGFPLHRRQHGQRGGRKDRHGHRCGHETEMPVDHHQQERWGPHDGSGLQPDADGEDQRQTDPARQERACPTSAW
jgi:hypothetical protein